MISLKQIKRGISGKKKHLPNLSGTKYAYEPKNMNQGLENSNKGREYTSWSPKE